MTRKMSLYEKSPELIKQWHPTLNKNTPYEPCGNKEKFWWICEQKHEWEATIHTRIINKTNCPFCAHQRVTETNNFAYVHPTLSKEWHPYKNENLTPNQVFCSSNKVVWWVCPNNHEWQSSIYNRNRGLTCFYCKSLSYLNPQIALEWHPYKNGDLTPDKFTVASGKRVWWMCKNGHEWQTIIKHRTTNQSNCPNCFKPSKGELRIECILNKLSIKYDKQYYFADCRGVKRPLPFDFVIHADLPLAIEFQGRQHYENVWGQDTLSCTIKNDEIKMNYCKQNNIPLLIISYWENIETKVIDFINKFMVNLQHYK